MARNVQVMSRSFLVDATGRHYGIQLDFGNGSTLKVRFDELPEAVLDHACANGLGEAFRDIGAGRTADEAYAGALKRLEIMKGGEYAARGGTRLAWVGDILEAARRLDPKATEETMAQRRASLEAMSPEDLRAWLKDSKRRPLAKVVDLIRKERAAERAKASTTGTTLDW
jgi:hypothetical protein